MASPLRFDPHADSGVYLTPEGRRRLEERVHQLQATVHELRTALDDPERRADSVDASQRACQELARLEAVVEQAESIEEGPGDPRVVELGDTVTIALEDGTEETYIIVHGAEAPVDDLRISAQSPLGAALLSRRVGDVVAVAVPAGTYHCKVLRATREP
jgi:transcription elongation factor GreA